MVKTYERTQDVLDHARAFHSKLSELYENLAEEAQQERVKMLLTYLSRHEEHMEESLAGYEEGASRSILDTWFKYIPGEAKLLQCEGITLEPDMSVDDIVAAALRMDNCLVDLYKEMAATAVSQEVKEVFANLLRMEEQQQHKLVRNTLLLQDI